MQHHSPADVQVAIATIGQTLAVPMHRPPTSEHGGVSLPAGAQFESPSSHPPPQSAAPSNVAKVIATARAIRMMAAS
jgi:hypothetical protein